MFELFQTAFRDVKFEVDDMIAEGDKVFVRARMTGTHRA
jgi:predicted ester cyclase